MFNSEGGVEDPPKSVGFQNKKRVSDLFGLRRVEDAKYENVEPFLKFLQSF